MENHLINLFLNKFLLLSFLEILAAFVLMLDLMLVIISLNELINVLYLDTLLIKKVYKLFSPDTNSSFISRDVKFYEYVFPYNMRSTSVDLSLNGGGPCDPFSYNDVNVNE